MKQVKYFVYGTSHYITPHYMMLSELPAVLRDGEKSAREAMHAAGTAHAVYAVKKYTGDGEIEQVDFYNPPVCLDDSDFYKRSPPACAAAVSLRYTRHRTPSAEPAARYIFQRTVPSH